MNAKEFFAVLQKKLWIPISVAVLAGVVSFFAFQNSQKKYRSVAKLEVLFPDEEVKKNRAIIDIAIQNHIEAMKTEFIGFMVSYNLMHYDLTENVPFRGNQFLFVPAERLKARTRLKEKLNSFELLSPYDGFENKLLDVVDQKYKPISWTKDDLLRIERIDKSNFIQIDFYSENPSLSAFVVNNLCSEYIRYNNYLNSVGDPTDSLARLVEQRRLEWEAKVNQLNNYKSSRNVKAEYESEDQLAELSEYEDRVRNDERRIASLKVSIQEVERKIDEFDQGTVSTDVRSTAKVTSLQSKLDDLNKLYAQTGSGDKELASTISNLRNQLQAELNRLDNETQNHKKNREDELSKLLREKERLDTEHRVASASLASVRNNMKGLKRSAKPSLSPDTRILLEREYDQALKNYLVARDRYNKIKNEISSQDFSTVLRIITAGQPNTEPESTMSWMLAAIVTSIAFLLTAAVLLVFAYFRTPPKPMDSSLFILR